MAKWWGCLKTVVQAPSPPSLLRSLYSQSSFYHTIQATTRDYTGSRVSSRERTQGRIPAVVFCQELLNKNPSNRFESRKQLLTIDRKQIRSILKSVKLPYFCSTTFPFQIHDGPFNKSIIDSGTVLPIKVHRNEETGEILNLVFVWADKGLELKVDVPVVFKGEEDCPGIKKGGRLNMIRKSLKFLCPAEHIPQKIEVDVSSLDIGDKVNMHDVKVHSSLRLLSKNENIPICKIVATDLGSTLNLESTVDSESPEPAQV